MKKQSKGIFFLWVLIVAIFGGAAFLLAEHLGVGTAPSGAGSSGTAPSSTPSAAQPYADVMGDVSAVALQSFSSADGGYSFSVPASWEIEKTSTDTVAVHAEVSSSSAATGGTAGAAPAACKIEVSAFPYSGGADGMADWIAHRIGADPSVAVTEQSSEQISLAGDGTGVEWIGTLDGVPTTLVYAFNTAHAYEIAPSVMSEGADGNAQCDSVLQSFLSTFKI